MSTSPSDGNGEKKIHFSKSPEIIIGSSGIPGSYPTSRPIKAPNSALLRFRTLWTNSKKPKYRGSFSCESPRCGRSHERSKDQNPSMVLNDLYVQLPHRLRRIRRNFSIINHGQRPWYVVLGRPPRGGRLREVAPVGGVELERSKLSQGTGRGFSVDHDFQLIRCHARVFPKS